MSKVQPELRYLPSHEWARADNDGIVTVGISDHAQETLGDIVYIEMPRVGTSISMGEEAGVVESVKAASDIYSPVSGEIVAVNELLEDAPETVNTSPYGDGWFFKVRAKDVSELKDTLSAEDYRESIGES